MMHGITWYTLEEADAKYSLKKSLILKWVEEGIVRAEHTDSRVMRVDAKDLERMVREAQGIAGYSSQQDKSI